MSMKKLLAPLTLLFLVACQPSDLDKCLDFNTQNLNKDYPRGNLLNELDNSTPDLNLIDQYFDELNLYYGSYALKWSKGLPLNKEEYINLQRSYLKSYDNPCLIFDFNDYMKFIDCEKKYAEDSGVTKLSEDEGLKLYKKEIKKALKISYKEFQEGISGNIFIRNHAEEISGRKSNKSFSKQPEDMILSNYLELLAMTLEANKRIIDSYKSRLTNEPNELIKAAYENQLKISNNSNIFAFRFINSSINSGISKQALDICHSQGIY